MESISNDDHRSQRSFLGLLYGLRQHLADIDVAATAALSPIDDA